MPYDALKKEFQSDLDRFIEGFPHIKTLVAERSLSEISLLKINSPSQTPRKRIAH